MGGLNLFSRNFLISLTFSLLFHLLFLLAILLPSDNKKDVVLNGNETDNSSNFSPSLLIIYSNEKLQKALSELADFNTMIPRQQETWRLPNFKKSFQQSCTKKQISLTSISIHESRDKDRLYTLKVIVNSSIESILVDCICLCYLTGVATTHSNFRSEDLIIVFSHESGDVINVKVTTSDCRLYSNQKITVDQFMQKITIS